MGSRKALPKDRKNRQQLLVEEDRRIRRSQENALREIEQEAKDFAHQYAQLAGYEKYKEAYNKNLVREGFKIRRQNWERSYVTEDGTTQFVRFKQLPKVNSVCNIPSNLDSGRCTYENVSWEEIKNKHMWYLKRNANYSSLGFVVNKTLIWTLPHSNDMFAFNVDRFLSQVWTWSDAPNDNYLPPDRFPLDDPNATYQDRSITEMDDFILQQPGKEKYLNDINRLPSAQLGDWKDDWHRHMRQIDVDVIETYVSVPAQSSPVNISKPRSDDDWFHDLIHRLLYSTREFYRSDWLSLRKLEEEEKQQRCYDRKIWRQLLETVDWLSYIASRRGVWLSLFQRCSFWSNRTLPNERKYVAGHTTYEVPGTLNGRKVAAFPDSGSAYNLLSHSYINQKSISFEKQESTIILPNGTRGQTIGFVSLDWVFEDAPDEVHKILFYVLKNCVHDVLLGKPFLDHTKLNTENDSRIKQRIVLSPPSSKSLRDVIYDCHLTGNILNSMSGNLNGLQSYVIPDSGCQVNAMSLAQALAFGWDGKYGGERGTFRFIDGSTALSLGAMKAMWSPTGSEEKYELEFEIMEDCKGIIVGQKFLYGNRAFVKHAASMITADGGDIRANDIPIGGSKGTISTTIDLGSPAPSPQNVIRSTLVPIPAHEVITTDDKIYGVTYDTSPFARIRRRLRGSRSRDAGATSQTSSPAQEEMEMRATTENAIASTWNREARILAVEAEVIRRRLAGGDGTGNVTLLSLLPHGYVGPAREDGDTGDGSGGAGRGGNENGDETSGSS